MAGVGPAPKDPAARARRNKGGAPQTILRFERAEAPELPDFRIDAGEDGLVEFVWPARTREWWDTWVASPQAEHFSSTDWEFLLDTALIHAKVWSGDTSVAAELRLRVAKFGSTMEDRARLRMTFAQADDADAGQGSSGAQVARERYAKIRMIRPDAPGTEAESGG
ncbi:phage terminase small subunit [Kitasatospora sp. NPDC003701]